MTRRVVTHAFLKQGKRSVCVEIEADRVSDAGVYAGHHQRHDDLSYENIRLVADISRELIDYDDLPQDQQQRVDEAIEGAACV